MKKRDRFISFTIVAIILLTNIILNITVTNAATVNSAIYKDNNCKITFDFPYEINTIWDGEIKSHDGINYTIEHKKYNNEIKADSNVIIGFTAKRKDNSKILPPSNVKVSSSASNNEKPVVPPDQDNTENFDNEGYYSNIKTNSFIEFGFNFSGTLPDNKKIQLYQMKLYNIQDFVKDQDGDGISDDLEVNKYGTSPNKTDTDGDGLSDYYEIFVSNTDPLKTETKKGIKDSDLDLDNDGLTVIEEVELETNPLLTDTYYDGLSDGDEVKVYKTNPLQYDTDYDGLSDYDEIILGLDPLKKDTGNTGELDSKKIVKQVITDEIKDGKGINKVEIVLKATGNVSQDTYIDEVYDISDLSSNKALIGAPIEIEIDRNLKENAIVKFHFDTSILKKVSNTENLALVLYDETKQVCKILNSTLQTNDAIISAETKVFGEFCIMDKSKLPEKVLEKRSLIIPATKGAKNI